jgi:aminopeptidase N
MLRTMLGDKAFFDGLRIYYNEHKDATATSDDLRAALEKASGRSLKDFFDRWIYKAGHPIYKVSWRDAGKGKTQLTLDQMQTDEAFLQPVTLLIKMASGDRRVVITPTGKSTSMAVNVPAMQSVIVDPDENILKEVVN